jgi:hypothetical protein
MFIDTYRLVAISSPEFRTSPYASDRFSCHFGVESVAREPAAVA